MLTQASLKEWLTEAVVFYRARGFFSTIQGDTSEVVEKLLPYLTAQNQVEELDLEELQTPEFDLFLLSCDPLRALYDSIEFGDALQEGNDAYVATLNALAKISRGAFLPKDVEELWDSPEGPIQLGFEFQERECALTADLWDGVFDFRILLQLNQLLRETAYRFEMAPLDDILFVTVLRAEEKTDLERERDLSFMVLDLPRTFHPIHRFTPPLALPEDPDTPTFYAGTLNEHLDRCVGRLRWILRGEEVEGHHSYRGLAHQEDFTFRGGYDRSENRLEGDIEGAITVDGESRAYEGVWRASFSPGDRILTGTWVGWFVSDRAESGERPTDSKLLYRGELGLIEEELLGCSELYVRRVRRWLEAVWECQSADDYPWLLPL